MREVRKPSRYWAFGAIVVAVAVALPVLLDGTASSARRIGSVVYILVGMAAAVFLWKKGK